MNKERKETRQLILLNFPPDISSQPVISDLARKFGLNFNILKAKITPRQEGYMTIELSGSEENYKKGSEYLKEHGVRITQAAQTVYRDEESCIHCGTCTAICPVAALHVNYENRKIDFDPQRCTACGMCLKVCPLKAMLVRTEDLDNF